MKQSARAGVGGSRSGRPRRVALLIETSRTYGRGILQGIARYAHTHGPWSFYTTERELHSGVPDWMRSWKGDGIIARIEDRRMADDLSRCGCPVINVLGQARLRGISSFDSDATAIAKMAADFFLRAGFRHFAYCGYEGIPFSDQRGRALVARLGGAGHEARISPSLAPPGRPSDIQGSERQGLMMEAIIAAWLKKQPRAVGRPDLQ